MTAISPACIAAIIASASIAATRALAWASWVWIGTCQPSQLRALQPIACRVSARRPAGHLLAAGHDNVVLGRVVERVGLTAEGDQPVGFAGHRRDHHRDFVPRACCLRTIEATRRMRSVLAIEVPPNFITMRAKERRSCWSRVSRAVRGTAWVMQLSQP